MARKRRSPILLAMEAEIAEATAKRLEILSQARAHLAETLARPGARLAPEEIIARLTNAGSSALTLKRAKAALAYHPRADRLRELASARRAEIARLNGEGMNDSQIAAAIGITRAHVCRLRGELGIPAVKRGRNA